MAKHVRRFFASRPSLDPETKMCIRDSVRTFCMNPYGFVVTENNNGLMTVNGHSYANKKLSLIHI